MRRGTLTCVTDGSYMQNLNPEVSGAGWIIQDTTTGRRVSGLLAEWPTSAGSYRGELLGMLAIRVFLLAAESFYGAATSEHANKVSCDNKSALHTFEKKNKRVTSSSSNANVRRALREVNKQATNKYQLEHVKGHQDRNKKRKDLSLEARLNIECDGMAKGAVRSAAQDPMRDWRQKLPLEYASVYMRGRKQTSDPGKDLKQQRSRPLEISTHQGRRAKVEWTNPHSHR